MMELIPESVDLSFLSEDHQCKPCVTYQSHSCSAKKYLDTTMHHHLLNKALYNVYYLFLALRKHLCTLVSTTAERLEMVPPFDGGIDSQQSLQLFVSPVTTQYRYRSESFSENVRSGVHKVSRHVIPTNPDKIGMVGRKGKN